jgi:hypothetical protein
MVWKRHLSPCETLNLGPELASEHKVYKNCVHGENMANAVLKKLQFMNYEFKKKYFREENLEIGSNSEVSGNLARNESDQFLAGTQ